MCNKGEKKHAQHLQKVIFAQFASESTLHPILGIPLNRGFGHRGLAMNNMNNIDVTMTFFYFPADS